jgi:GH15 family glucan-1,4-alpha-glucosidase
MARGLGIIGNCAYSALVDRGSIEWLCWPRPDSSFVFGPLLDREKGGAFIVEGVDTPDIEMGYLENTNVLRTVFRGPAGAFELLDFAPRFSLFDRYFKPLMLVRILRPIEGEPRAIVRCRPVYDYGASASRSWLASNHIQYADLPTPVRLTANVPLTYVQDERPFLLERDHHLVLTWGEPLESGLEETAERFLERTLDYWRGWVKSTRTPRDYQREVIRSALCLKLHQFQDTGALIAAPTTSLTEHPGSGRTWDYRYCWLRDAYFTLNALERLGHNTEMERFLVFLRNLCEEHAGELQPVYTIAGGDRAPEVELDLAGHQGEQPVRIGNQAFEHVQNDVYGEMILAVSRLFLDVRFAGDIEAATAVDLLSQLLDRIERTLETPDAGPWELRGTSKLHGFTILCHWAGAGRAVEVSEVIGDEALAERARLLEARARVILEEQFWNEEIGALTQAAGEPQLDAVLLLAVQMGFFAGDEARAIRHVRAIQRELRVDGDLLKRYVASDDFGRPVAAFTACSFWLVEALALLGFHEEGRELFDHLLELHNGLGLYSEDLLPGTLEQSGNFPQSYSHVGLINAAFRLSRRWE